jgi:hypothetical protein
MMEINPADNQILGLNELLYQKTVRPSEQNGLKAPDAFNNSFEGYITRALSGSSEETVDIEQIRKEMNSGQFDSPEAIGQAARNILSYGV